MDGARQGFAPLDDAGAHQSRQAFLERDRPDLARERDLLMQMLQRGRSVNANVNVVIITHQAQEAALLRALKRLQANAALVEPPHMMRIENQK